jgi:hypothetical protein
MKDNFSSRCLPDTFEALVMCLAGMSLLHQLLQGTFWGKTHGGQLKLSDVVQPLRYDPGAHVKTWEYIRAIYRERSVI